MEWIKSNEREPLNCGRYFCKYNNIKLVLEFVKIKPKRENFIINEHFEEQMLDEIIYWTEDVNDSTQIKSNEELMWLEEK